MIRKEISVRVTSGEGLTAVRHADQCIAIIGMIGGLVLLIVVPAVLKTGYWRPHAISAVEVDDRLVTVREMPAVEGCHRDHLPFSNETSSDPAKITTTTAVFKPVTTATMRRRFPLMQGSSA